MLRTTRRDNSVAFHVFLHIHGTLEGSLLKIVMEYKSKYQGKIKIFSDGAEPKAMLEMAKDPKIKGITTNPSLMKAAGVKNYKEFCKEILKQVTTLPISFEVFADDFKEMKRQALEIASWGKNVYVKIPVTNSHGEASYPLIKELAASGVKLNITAIFTLEQVKDTCEALKDGPESIVSVFAGRIADAGIDPLPIMKESLNICKKASPKIELLWASTREVYNIVEAEAVGCHIITVPPAIISKMSSFNKDLKKFSLETVKMFKKDSDDAGFSL